MQAGAFSVAGGVMTVQSIDGASPPPAKAARFSWALFDWAHQPYFTLVGAFLFKPYFSSDFIGDPIKGQAMVGYAGGAAAALVAILSPLLGARLDSGGRPKAWTVAASVMFVAACCGLWFAAPGRTDLVPLIVGCLIVAAASAELMITANNAMLQGLAAPKTLGRLSGSAVALGYAGGLVALIVYMLSFNLLNPFGLDKAAHEPERITGPFAAVWYVIFVLPMLLWTPETRKPAGPARETLTSILRLLRSRPQATRFLVGRMLIGDGLTAASVFAGVLAAGMFDWGTAELGAYAVGMVVLSGIGAWMAGKADDRFGPKASVMVCVAALCVGIAGVGFISADRLFFVIPITPPAPGDGFLATTGERIFMVLGLVIGLSAGPLQASMRSWMANIAPAQEVGRWFGLFAFSNKATAFAAPLIIGVLTTLTSDQRVTIPVVLVFLIAGLLVLRTTRQDTVSGER